MCCQDQPPDTCLRTRAGQGCHRPSPEVRLRLLFPRPPEEKRAAGSRATALPKGHGDSLDEQRLVVHVIALIILTGLFQKGRRDLPARFWRRGTGPQNPFPQWKELLEEGGALNSALFTFWKRQPSRIYFSQEFFFC